MTSEEREQNERLNKQYQENMEAIREERLEYLLEDIPLPDMMRTI